MCEALGLSKEMVTLREPTLRGDRGDRGGETESSDMLVAATPGSLYFVTRRSLLGARAAPIFWEVGSWGLCGAAGGCADLRMGSAVRNPGCTIGGCGRRAAASVWPVGTQVTRRLPRPPRGLADAEGSVPYDSGAPRKEEKKT